MQKVIKNLVATLLFLIVFLMIGRAINYILTDDTRSYTRLMMHELQHSPENIDVLFVGSSHVYRGLVPDIADASFGKYTFDASSASQYMDGSLAVIKEALRYHDVEEIYLEMYYGVAGEDAYADRKQMTATYLISDYMTPSVAKVQYLLHASSKEYYPTGFLIFRRNWEKIFDADYVKSVIEKKRTDAYRHYEWDAAPGEVERYISRGYVVNDSVLSMADVVNGQACRPVELKWLLSDSDYLDSLHDIIALCRHKEIRLTLFVTPMPEWTVTGVGNYDEYHALISAIAEENGIRFCDFNYCRPAFFDAKDISLFMDYEHLNTAGSELFTEVFCDFYTGKIKEDELFYRSLEEKHTDQDIYVYGIGGFVKNGDLYEGRVVANRQTGIFYRIIITPEDGEETVLQEFSENSTFAIPYDTHGTVRIEWYETGTPETVNVIEGTY